MFDWLIASIDGTAVLSSSGVSITPQCAVTDLASAPVVILLTSYEPEQACDPRLLSWLRRQDRQAALLACVDTAALVLARAGLLAQQRVAVHQEVAASYRETLGASVVLDRLWLFENRRLSSAGGAATIDMMLALIERVRGLWRFCRVYACVSSAFRCSTEQGASGIRLTLLYLHTRRQIT